MSEAAQATALAGRERDENLDLIRAVAGWLVVSVHFFLNICYYYEPLQGGVMLAMSVLRMACMTCVPLFLLLTGYLNCRKKLSGRYYLSIIRILLTYLLCTGVSLLFRRFWLAEPVGLREAVRMTLDFTGAATGWYIEMYIGLFLLIPFLNLLWEGAGDKKTRRWLVATLAALTALPAMLNVRHELLPDWWKMTYPLCYYFIGAYLREYPPKPRWYAPALGVAGSACLGGAWVFWMDHGQMFQGGDYTDWAGPTVMVSAVCLFVLLRQIPVKGWPGWLKWLVRKGAELSLGIYLVGWCFDNVYARLLWPVEPTVVGRLKWYFVLAPAVYFSSALVAQGVEWVRKAITWGLNRAFPKANLK